MTQHTDTAPEKQEKSPNTGKVVFSETLMEGSKTLIIRHRDSDYCLRVTGNDKLILTK